jgi:hypothetical protein
VRDAVPGGARQRSERIAIEVDDVRRKLETIAQRAQRIVCVPVAYGGQVAGATRLQKIHERILGFAPRDIVRHYRACLQSRKTLVL